MVSIPSRRVGDDSDYTGVKRKQIGFHPLKAGRRLTDEPRIQWLKDVSIPSRRVGDLNLVTRTPSRLCSFHPLKAGRRRRYYGRHGGASLRFPSPQGGSETNSLSVTIAPSKKVSIPSRRVGDLFYSVFAGKQTPVSIPSRRVGDLGIRFFMGIARRGFHPLKAGRRPRFRHHDDTLQ